MGLQHHISPIFLPGIQFALCRFRSPLLTASQLISFPGGTKMFQFPSFPILTDRTPEGVQEVPLGNLRIKGSLRLPGAYRSLARPSSAPEPSHPPNSEIATGVLLNTHPDCIWIGNHRFSSILTKPHPKMFLSSQISRAP